MKVSVNNSLLVYKGEYSPETVQRLISENRLSGLEVCSLLRDERLSSLEFLSSMTFLKELRVVSNYPYNLDVLANLNSLRSLNLNIRGFDGIRGLEDFELESLNLSLRRNKVELKLPSTLENMYMDEVQSSNLKFLSGGSSLRSLRIKSSQLKSLRGIENFMNLEYLYLGGVSGLKELGRELPNSIKKIELESLSSLKTIDLSHVNHDVVLNVSNCPMLSR